MPIGATIGAAVVGAGASIGGAVLGAGAQRDAARTASDTAAGAAASNNALSREIYGYNAARLDPTVQSGLRAGGALNGLLLGPAPAGTGGGALGGGSGLPGPAGMNFTPEQQWAQGAINAMLPRISRSSVRNQLASMQNDPVGALNYLMTLSPPSSDQYPLYQAYVGSNPRPAAGTPATPATGTPATGTPATGTPATGTPANGALSAWDQFRNSTNYQFRFDQGNKAVQMSALPTGGYDSGQTRKALTEYGQNFAANELGAYMDRLAQQQSFGVGAASALAGVGQNMVGQISANNNNAAGAAANAALVNGSATANMYGQIGGALGTAAGSIFGGPSSFASSTGYGQGSAPGGWDVNAYGGWS
jgi:hypothetical protein